MANNISLEEAENNIPDGMYCYTHKNNSFYLCPYWEKTEIGARCNYLELESEEKDPNNLIWDQCKECGINKQFGNLFY